MQSLYHKNVLSQLDQAQWAQTWKPLLLRGLQDDGWPWDWTALGLEWKPVSAKVIAKAKGIWSAGTLVQAVELAAAELSTEGIKAKSLKKTGEKVKPGDVVAQFEGPAPLILALERTFLNLACYSCGIATATHAHVEKVKKACPQGTPRVTSTRKILPFYRDLALYSVQAGGGYSHRTNLASGILIKENHIAAAGGIEEAIEVVRGYSPHGLKVEIEVRDLKELAKAMDAGAEVIMLDNFTPAQVKAAVKEVKKRFPQFPSVGAPVLEVSGGLNVETIHRYAIAGVGILSVGGLTHSPKALDLSLLVGNK